MFGIASHMPIRRMIWYAVLEHQSFRYELKTVFQDPKDQAVDAAEDYWNNHDGLESTWPLEFSIFESEDGPLVAAFDVEAEHTPQFYAHPVKEEPQSPGVDGGASGDTHA